MTHGEHTKATQLLRSVKHDRGKTTRHLGVQTNLDTCLDLKDNNVHCVRQVSLSNNNNNNNNNKTRQHFYTKLENYVDGLKAVVLEKLQEAKRFPNMKSGVPNT